MDRIFVLDFGGQYCHLIARRIRSFGVWAEVVPPDIPAPSLAKDATVKGVILSGGARSVYERNAPRFDRRVLRLPIPIFGICYGHQLLAHLCGGRVVSGQIAEYGLTELRVSRPVGVLAGLQAQEKVWMNHRDVVTRLPKGFSILAQTGSAKVAAFQSRDGRLSGVQFHPEVSHTPQGDAMLRHFVFGIARCARSYSPTSIAQALRKEARQVLGRERAIIGLSGGIDSTVAALLVSTVLKKRLTAVYVDTGMMREGETALLQKSFRMMPFRLRIIHAERLFFSALKAVTAPERKRKIIGRLFADVFLREARKARASFLIQGTIYSDRIESGGTKHAATIKSHHNVGGLPKQFGLRVYEPLRDLYKDEVRALARSLHVPNVILHRQVFPGPGLAVRIIGEVTPERVRIVQRAGAIIEQELRPTRFWKRLWMSFPVLLPIRSVGIQGDARSYRHPIVLRLIESRDAMTASVPALPFPLLQKIATRITNEIREVNRVVLDLTNKPPGTMEWE